RLAELLADHRLLSVVSAEGDLIGMVGGRHAKNGRPALDVWLKGHTGEDHIVDRKTSRGCVVRNPALSIALAVQPGVLGEMVELRRRGFPQRFFYSLPSSNIGRRKIDPGPMLEYLQADWEHVLDRMVRIRTPEADEETPSIGFDPTAVGVLNRFAEAIEPQMGPGGDLEHIADWTGKLVGGVARVACLLHLADYGAAGIDAPIAEETVERACTIGRYFIQHAIAAFDEMRADPTLVLARRMLAAIQRRSAQVVSERDLMQWLKGGRTEREERAKALILLVDYGWLHPVRSAPKSGPGRKPGPRYAVAPQALGRRPQDPRNLDPASSNTTWNHSQNPRIGRFEGSEDENGGTGGTTGPSEGGGGLS
ncbi:MAG: DUF3987 domain-containing protein, partial [Myxococcaceae bacterium]